MNGTFWSFITLVVVSFIYFEYMRRRKPSDESEEKLSNNMKGVYQSLINESNNIIIEAIEKVRDIVDLTSEVENLRKEKSKLKAEISTVVENQTRREREIDHKIGLERARQKQELELGLREARLEVKEGNLITERQQFEKNMEFMQNRFMEEVKYQRELSERLLKALPNMTINKTITESKINV